MHHQYLDVDTIQLISEAKNSVFFKRAVELAIAYALPLPSQPVESPLSYFDDSLKQVSCDLAGVFTEVRPLSISEAVDNVRSLWNARYAIAHGSVVSQITAGSGLSPSILSIFGISYNVPAALLEELSENAASIEPIFAKALGNIVRTGMVSAVLSKKD